MERPRETRGVRILLGNPKKAVVTLALPMIAAMSAQTLYNLVDAIWVSGKGSDALSAVGFTFPFYFMAMALASGVGIGGGAAISRQIGARNRSGANDRAVHTVVLMLVVSTCSSLVMLVFAERVMRFMGAGSALHLAVRYARITFAGIVFVFFVQTAVSILRAEGDTRRAMYVMMGGVVLNIALDPLFIYGFDLGVAGAAVATVISMAIVSAVTAWWLFVQNRTYVSFRFRGFRFSRRVTWDIARVGLPATASHASMSLMALALTRMVSEVGGPRGVAVYTTGWRVISMATLPVLGMASAVTAVVGAAYGARTYERMRTAYLFALKIGIGAEVVLAVLIYTFARQVTWVFAWSKASVDIVDDLVVFLRTLVLFLPTVPVGMLSSGLFQGTGKGVHALALTLIRTLVFTVPFAWFLGLRLDWGLIGIWTGMVAAGLAYIPIAYLWADRYTKRLLRSGG